MDRCALFVDAGYVLADGGMAVHGTRRRGSVSWDYEGLLHLLASLATERSGLPLLRCYWYEATVEGRRSGDHDTLADLPGVKLRLAKIRPGRRDGVESQIHRDLETLARNRAVSDAVVVSADEDLAEVIAGVQDLGMRVTLLHIAVDGDWTISRALREECDDIAEISIDLLRPYAELISGAEPPHPDEQQDQQDSAQLIALRPTAGGNGNGQAAAQGTREPQAAPADISPPAPSVPAGPTDAGIVQLEALPGRHAEAMPPRQPEPVPVRQPEAIPPRQPEPVPVRQATPPLREEAVRARQEPAPVRQPAAAGREEAVPLRREAVPARPAAAAMQDLPGGQDMPGRPDMQVRQDQQPAWPATTGPREPQPVRELYAAPVGMPGPVQNQPADLPAARPWQPADLSGYIPGAPREQAPRDMMREPQPREPLSGDAGDGLHAAPAAQGSAQIRHLPTRGTVSPAQPQSPAQPLPAHQAPGQHARPGGQEAAGRPTAVPSLISAPMAVPSGVGQQATGHPMAPGAGYAPGHNGSYSGPQPVVPPLGAPGAPGAPGTPGLSGLVGPAGPVGPVGGPVGPVGGQPGNAGMPAPVTAIGAVGAVGQQGVHGGPTYTPAHGPNGGPPPAPSGPIGAVAYPGGQPSVSLAEAVQSAHDEGQDFGSSIARDAPALWLEAVLARKPRMPSDLEARLLQGSALPIDFLLHDEVRHALRRGFWDALERARRLVLLRVANPMLPRNPCE